MSRGQHNSAHGYHGRAVGRGPRLKGKLGRAITLRRLDALLKGGAMDGEKPEGEKPPEPETPADEKKD